MNRSKSRPVVGAVDRPSCTGHPGLVAGGDGGRYEPRNGRVAYLHATSSYRVVFDSAPDRGQSSTVGVILILGLTLTGAATLVTVGGDAIQGTQSQSEIGQAEEAMTQFDSRAAQVALGDSESQNIPLGGHGGQHQVEADAGRVRIVHENWNGTDCDGCDSYAAYDNTTDNGNTTILYNETLGAVTFDAGDTTIAYQGGGVWRGDTDGGSTVVSSPEFHYRDATLTFPLARVDGTGSTAGRTTAQVERVRAAGDVYPNASRTYPDGTTRVFNPVQNGNVSVEITSEYCEAWRSYFLDRTEGQVSDCNGGTVTADIITLGTQGEFPIQNDNQLQVRGQEPGHTLQDLEFSFRDDTASDFNNLGWSLAGESGDKRLEIYVEKRGGGTPSCGDPVRTVIYYSDDGGDTYHTWVLDGSHGNDPYEIRCPDDAVIDVDLLNASRSFEYTDASNHGSDDLLKFDTYDTEGRFNGSEQLTGHPADPDTTASSGTEEPADLVTQHHFTLMDDTDMEIRERTQGGANAGLSGESSGTINYDGNDKVLTYLHITENRIRVELS